MAGRRRAAEEQAQSAERTITLQATNNAALEATVKSAELYFQALRLADNPADRKRLDTKTKELLAKAEKLKISSLGSLKPPQKKTAGELKIPLSARKLTTRENIIVLEGSKLNGFIFKPWAGDPLDDEFALKSGEDPFTDSHTLPLSASQLESFGGWKRPREALARDQRRPDGEAMILDVIMRSPENMDLVQDMTSDCSVVASLCAVVSRSERGNPKILRAVVHPYDYTNDDISLSANGKYILKLYFNGTWRRVEIDDHLPTSRTKRVLHVIDRQHPTLLWPALVEKAYLKVRGGYDFPGSNSGTDLAVLTGWIPQQIFLHDENVEPDALWDEILTHFLAGDILITIGTGKLPRREQSQLGLAAEHDYAILDISARGHHRELLVKNPWADGDVWRGATRRKANPSSSTPASPTDTPVEDEAMMPGTFWMDFNSVFQFFENMYINWNPCLFRHRSDLHFSWTPTPSPGNIGSIVVDNPQFSVTASASSEVWILLNRHFRTGDYTQATTGKNGYISLYLYSRSGHRVISSTGAKVRGPFVDSPNTLIRFPATANTAYTVVAVGQDLPPGKINFTLSAFSKCAVSLADAALQYPAHKSIGAAWTRNNAGGNSDNPRYLDNPQVKLTLNSPQKVAIVLRIARQGDGENSQQQDMHVKVLVVFSTGSRITRLKPRDVVAHSGDYRRGSAVVETELGKGQYCLICSTFDADQQANFTLDCYASDESSSIMLLPAEGAGRLHIETAPAVFSSGVNRMLAPLSVPRITRVRAIARLEGPLSSGNSSLYKMTIEQGQGPYKKVVASSEIDQEEFGSVRSGLRIEDLDLSPQMGGPGTGGLWLVLERLSQGEEGTRAEEVLNVGMWTEERIEFGAWGLGDG